jgi:hypothetical protein
MRKAPWWLFVACLALVSVSAQRVMPVSAQRIVIRNSNDPDNLGAFIDATRVIDWDPGVPGGIPARSTACYTDSGGLDSVSTLNTQIAACTTGQVVQLQAGTYTIDAQIQISKGVTLRGASVDTTILDCTASWHCVQMGDFPSAPSGINVTANVAKDATTITVASTTGLAVDDYIAIDQLNDGTEVVNDDTAFGAGECRSGAGTRCLGQIVKITAINSLVLTVTPSIHHAYTAGALDPEVWEVTGVTTNAGLEDLTITRSNDPDGGYNNIKMIACSGCWVENIVSDTPDDWHVDIDRSIWAEIRDSYFGFGTENTSGSAYGVVSNLFATDGLIENNIFEHLRHGMLVQNGATGNVYGYNYSFDCYQGEDWLATDINSHGSHTAFNLWEGNSGCKVYGDNAHGSSSYNTVYRNHIRRESTPTEGSITQALRAVDIEVYNRYWNIVGNILGTNGQTWEAFDPGATRVAGSSGRYVYTFGYFSDGDTSRDDATIVTDTYVHGNYDDQSNSQIWDAGNSNHTLLDSLYLDAEPAFFSSGSCVWPPMVPGAGTANMLPAEDLATGGDGTCAEESFYYTGTLREPSCSDASIDSAISSSSSGDIVRMSSACSSFTASIVIPNTKGILFDGNGSTFNSSSTIDVDTNASISTRLTDFTMACSDGGLEIDSDLTDAKYRVDHVTLTGSSHRCITTNGFGTGLFDHITIAELGSVDEFIHHEAGGCGSDTSYSVCNWDTALTPGSGDAIYTEDSTFTCPSCDAFAPAWQQSYYGARIVNRFNAYTDVNIDNHGTAGNVGGRWWEVYNNSFATGGNWDGAILNLRAGSGLVFSNTRGGSPIQDAYGACEEDTGYPAAYQIGRGQSGALVPAYFFASGTLNVTGCSDAANNGSVTTNVDYYDAVGASCTAGGSCTTGVGTGTTLPTSCTIGVGFWKTDAGGDWWTTGGDSEDGALYVCTDDSPLTWTLYYTPYIYPHPLQAGLEPDK